MENEKTNPAAVEESSNHPAPTTSDEHIASLTSASAAPAPGEISAATIARMMGLATSGDLKLLQGKLDLIVGRVATLSTRIERVVTLIGQAPTGSDLERIDVQIGSLKAMLREFVSGASTISTSAKNASAKPGAPVPSEHKIETKEEEQE